MKYTKILINSIASMSLVSVGYSLNSCMGKDENVLGNNETNDYEMGKADDFLNISNKNNNLNLNEFTQKKENTSENISEKEISIENESYSDEKKHYEPVLELEPFEEFKKEILQISESSNKIFKSLENIKNSKLKDGKWINETSKNIKNGIKFLKKISKNKIDPSYDINFYKIDNIIKTIFDFEKKLNTVSKDNLDNNFNQNLENYIKALSSLKILIEKNKKLSEKKKFFDEKTQKELTNCVDKKLKMINEKLLGISISKNDLDQTPANFEDIKKTIISDQGFFEEKSGNSLISRINNVWNEFYKLSDGTWDFSPFHTDKKTVSYLFKNLKETQNFFNYDFIQNEIPKYSEIKKNDKYIEKKKEFIETYKNLYKIIFTEKQHLDTENNNLTRQHRYGLEYVGPQWSVNKQAGIEIKDANNLLMILQHMAIYFAYIESEGEINLPLDNLVKISENEYKNKAFMSDKEYKNWKFVNYLLGGLWLFHGVAFAFAGTGTMFLPAVGVPLFAVGALLIGLGTRRISKGIEMNE